MRNNVLKNLKTVNIEDHGKLMGIILFDANVEFATLELANTLSGHIANIQNKIEFPFPAIFEMTPDDAKANYQSTAWGEAFVSKAKKAFNIGIKSNFDMQKRIQSIRSEGEISIALVYDDGALVGYTPSGTTKFKPFAMSVINPESLTDNDGSSKRGMANIRFAFKDSAQFEEFSAVVYPETATSPWNAIELECLTDVDIEVVGTPNATTIVVDVTTADSRNAGSANSFADPVLGLVIGDFEKLTALLATEVIASAVPVSGVAGRYTLSGTGLTTGLVGLKSPSLMTTKGFEATAKSVVTIA